MDINITIYDRQPIAEQSSIFFVDLNVPFTLDIASFFTNILIWDNWVTTWDNCLTAWDDLIDPDPREVVTLEVATPDIAIDIFEVINTDDSPTIIILGDGFYVNIEESLSPSEELLVEIPIEISVVESETISEDILMTLSGLFIDIQALGTIVATECDPSNFNRVQTLTDVRQAIGQQIFSGGGKLKSIPFWLSKKGTLMGHIRAEVYLASGPYGAPSVPVGPVLATSTPIDALSLTLEYDGTLASITEVEFDFTEADFEFIPDNYYCAVIHYTPHG